MKLFPKDTLVKLIKAKDWAGVKKELFDWLDSDDDSKKSEGQKSFERTVDTLDSEIEITKQEIEYLDDATQLIQNIKKAADRVDKNKKVNQVRDSINKL
jgi:hypothetical protein